MLKPGRYSTQKDNILAHLLTGRAITPIEALEQYGCFRLAAVVWNLKADGHKIKTKKITRLDKTFASYSLEKR
tara:strand:- start:123 stop:341 length:219 start_codon:yes stop_codon:yes gene_type:complete